MLFLLAPCDLRESRFSFSLKSVCFLLVDSFCFFYLHNSLVFLVNVEILIFYIFFFFCQSGLTGGRALWTFIITSASYFLRFFSFFILLLFRFCNFIQLVFLEYAQGRVNQWLPSWFWLLLHSPLSFSRQLKMNIPVLSDGLILKLLVLFLQFSKCAHIVH